MNRIMKRLTVVSTIFIPLTFLAGIWGMNFKVMPELDWRYGYATAWAIMILTAIGTWITFTLALPLEIKNKHHEKTSLILHLNVIAYDLRSGIVRSDRN